jgi:hypothetical protein
MRGKLRRRGNQSGEAVLLGAMTAVGGACQVEQAGLRTGARVLFVLSSSEEIKQLLTSAINQVVVIKQEVTSRTQ